jgi:hypothetical protein
MRAREVAFAFAATQGIGGTSVARGERRQRGRVSSARRFGEIGERGAPEDRAEPRTGGGWRVAALLLSLVLH